MMAGLVCGVCVHDRGTAVPLSGPYRVLPGGPMHVHGSDEPFYFCPFCDEERHVGGTKTRVTLVPIKTSSEYRNDFIAHCMRYENGKVVHVA